jgi:cell division septum initiation protein DivIVA
MNAKLAAIAVALLVWAGMRAVQAQTPGDDVKRLREEIQRIEAQIKELSAQRDSLKAKLAKAERSSPQPPALRFPIEIERAMLQDGMPAAVPRLPGSGRFDPLPEASPPMQPRRPK